MGFAQNLDYLMQKRGMTKYQLAKVLGCHQTSVTNWLENGTTPHKRTIEAIASVFGISTNELCADELPDLSKKEIPDPFGSGIDAETIELKEIWDTATADERELLIDIARSLKKRRSN